MAHNHTTPGQTMDDSTSHNKSEHNLIEHETYLMAADPMLMPLWKKIHATAASWFATFTLVYAATVITPAIPLLPKVFGTTTALAHFAFTAPFFGVFFAPIYTPHVSEKFGRKPVYVVALSLLLIFFGGISLAGNITQLIVLRFFAGLVGGPLAVLIEGTHADVWPAVTTVSYYVSIALSQYWGAAFGPIIGQQALAYGGPPWLAYSALCIGGFAWLLVVTMPETYPRELYRRQRKKEPSLAALEPALSGVDLRTQANLTVFTPVLMLFSDPLVIMGALLLGLSFAVVFQWFVVVPYVLANVYGLSAFHISIIFFAAVVGSGFAFITSIIIDTFGSKLKLSDGTPRIEARLFSAMFGVILTFLSLFWVGWTAKPTVHYIVPVTGTAVYVWGNMCILQSIVSFFFDAFHPQAILSALTAMACFRLACAGIIPIFILDMFNGLTPPWALSTFGFINLAFVPFPFIMYFFGEKLRKSSRFARLGDRESPLVTQSHLMQHDHEHEEGHGLEHEDEHDRQKSRPGI